MSWFFLALLLVLAFLLVATPLWQSNDQVREVELEKIKRHLLSLETETQLADQGSQDQSHSDLEYRALNILNSNETALTFSTGRTKYAAVLLFSLLTVTLYGLIGSPTAPKDYQPTLKKNIERAALEDVPLEVLIERLQQRLESDPNPPALGFQLLARSLMSLRRFDEAIIAYNEALRISESELSILAEFERAQAYIESQADQYSLSQSTIEAFDDLSPQQKDQAIQSMVTSLSNRLRQDPKDLAGWARLLRSRSVLDQKTEGQKEVNIGIAALSQSPNIQKQLIEIAVELGYSSDSYSAAK